MEDVQSHMGFTANEIRHLSETKINDNNNQYWLCVMKTNTDTLAYLTCAIVDLEYNLSKKTLTYCNAGITSN